MDCMLPLPAMVIRSQGSSCCRLMGVNQGPAAIQVLSYFTLAPLLAALSIPQSGKIGKRRATACSSAGIGLKPKFAV